MFDFSSSQMQLFGKTVTYYAVLPIPGVLLAAVAAALFCRRENLPARPAAYTVGVLFSAATIFRLYQSGIPASLLPFMFVIGAAGVAAAAYVAGRLMKTQGVHLCTAFATPTYMAVCKLGCFRSGCCIGRPYDGMLSVCYGDATLCSVKNVQLFPVQLLTAGLLFAAAFLAWTVLRRQKDICTYLAVSGLTPLAYYSGALLCDKTGSAMVLAGVDFAAVMAAASLTWVLAWMAGARAWVKKKL